MNPNKMVHINIVLLWTILLYMGVVVALWATARSYFEVGQRAYLTTDKIGLEGPLVVGRPVYVLFDVTNSGETPARAVVVGADVVVSADVVLALPQPRIPLPVAPYGSVNVLGSHQAIGRVRATFESGRVWTQADENTLARGWRVYFRAAVTYDTVFGQHGVTTRCGYHEGLPTDLVLTACPSGNELK